MTTAAHSQRLLRLLTSVAVDLDVDAVKRRVVWVVAEVSGASSAMFVQPRPQELDLDVLRRDGVEGYPGIDHFVPSLARDHVAPVPGDRVAVIPVDVGDRRIGQIYASVDLDSPGFSEQAISDLWQVAAVAGPAVANAKTYARAERRRRWLEGTVAVAGSLGRVLTLEHLDEGLVGAIQQMTGAKMVALVRSSGDGPTVSASSGERAVAERLVADLEEVIADAVATSDYKVLQQVRGAATAVIPLQPQLAPPVVLLIDHGGEWGHLRGVELDVVDTLVEHVSMFFDRIHAAAEGRRLELASDRERIARDLHDVVIQRLFATGLGLQGLRRRAELAGDEGTEQAVVDAVTELDLAMADLRASVFELQRQPGLSILGEIEQLLDDYSGPLGFRPSLRHRGAVDAAMGGLIRDHALAALRELLSNVAKHAGASHVTVELEATQDLAVVRVTDDGVGVDPGATPAEGGGHGMRNLGARARDLSGEVVVTPRVPRGTVVEWRVPTTRSRL